MPFYKKIENNVLEAINFVSGPFGAYELLIENKELYNYPVDGWYVFDTKRDAYEYFDVELPLETIED